MKAAWRADDVRELLVDAARAPLLLPVAVIVVAWVLCAVFVVIFLLGQANGG